MLERSICATSHIIPMKQVDKSIPKFLGVFYLVNGLHFVFEVYFGGS